jgi:acetyl/propionyl-CoA carboxylase alpha subunit
VLDDPLESRDKMENALKMNSLNEHQLTEDVSGIALVEWKLSVESENEKCLQKS